MSEQSRNGKHGGGACTRVTFFERRKRSSRIAAVSFVALKCCHDVVGSAGLVSKKNEKSLDEVNEVKT